MDKLLQDDMSLTKLYKSEHKRNLVKKILGEDFEYAFDRMVEEGNNIRSLLIPIAISNKELIKELVIEYGYDFDTLEHLKQCLDKIRGWDVVDECDHAALAASKLGFQSEIESD